MSSVLTPDLQSKLYLSLACVLSAVPCSVLGWKDRDGPGRLLSLAAIAFALGLPPLLFKEFLPRLPTVVGGNMVVLAAMGLHWHGAAQLVGHRPRPRWTVAVLPLSWAACWLCPRFSHDLDLRVAVAAAMTGALSLMTVFELLRPRANSMPLRLLLATSWLHVTISSHRLWFALDGDSFGHSAVWATCTDLNILGYVVLWPALGLLVMHQRLLEQERDRGRCDELSGVLNRRGFLGRAAGRDGDAVLLFDIDRFKRINDDFGHARGDEAIVTFAAVARSLLPAAAVFGRLGGEEFAAVVCERSFGEAERVAETIRAAFAATRLSCGITATVSVGIARSIAAGPNNIGGRLDRADRALYAAKHAGRNRVHVWAGETMKASDPAPAPAEFDWSPFLLQLT